MMVRRLLSKSALMLIVALMLLFATIYVQAQSASAAEEEALDLIESVAIESNHPGDASIATAGDSYTVTIVFTEEVDQLSLYVNNVLAAATSDDQLTYSAVTTVGEIYQTGQVELRIEYEKDGQAGTTFTGTTDGSTVTVGYEENLLSDLFRNAQLIDSTPGRALDVTITQVNTILDLNAATASDFRTESAGWGGWVAFDFGTDEKINLSQVKVLARQDQVGRVNGLVIQGTNHLGVEPWVDATSKAANSGAWQTLTTTENNKAYRYIRMYNAAQWFGNVAEVKFYGEAVATDIVSIEDVSIQSNHAEDSAYAQAGNIVTLSFTTNDHAPENLKALVGGQEVTAAIVAEEGDSKQWSAEYTIPANYTVGELGFQIYADNSAVAITSTSDDSSIHVVDSLAVIMTKAESFAKDNYIRLSYYQLQQELEFVRAAMEQPDYHQLPLVLKLVAAIEALESKGDALVKIKIEQAMVIASHQGWSSTSTKPTPAVNGWRAFDGDINTAVDNDTTAANWIEVDFGEGNAQALGQIRFHPRTGNNLAGRVNNSVIQGSNDGENYVDLYTITGVTSAMWHTVDIAAAPAYRYIRHSFPANTYGNIAELELYNPLGADISLLAFLYDAADGIDLELYTEATVEALTTAAAEAQALLAGNTAEQAEVDAASDNLQAALQALALKQAVDKSELNAAIIAAESLYGNAQVGTAPNQYPQAAKNAFRLAIDAAIGVYESEAADAATAAEAIANLATAVQTFNAAKIGEPTTPVEPEPTDPVDKAALVAVIGQAEGLLEKAANIAEGSKLGQYEVGAKAALQTAINEAKVINASANATEDDVEQTAAALQTAVDVFKTRFISLVPEQTQITIRDLAIAASYYGVNSQHADWQQIEQADILSTDEIGISNLAAIARFILDEWAASFK
jgi:hypothetical protein